MRLVLHVVSSERLVREYCRRDFSRLALQWFSRSADRFLLPIPMAALLLSFTSSVCSPLEVTHAGRGTLQRRNFFFGHGVTQFCYFFFTTSCLNNGHEFERGQIVLILYLSWRLGTSRINLSFARDCSLLKLFRAK